MLTNEEKARIAELFKTAFDRNKGLSLSSFAEVHEIPLTSMRRILSEHAPSFCKKWQKYKAKAYKNKEELAKTVIPFLKQNGNVKTEEEFDLTQEQVNQLIAAYNRKTSEENRVRKSDITNNLVITSYIDEDLTIDEIAEKLHLQKSTVSYHLNHPQLPHQTQQKIQLKKQLNQLNRQSAHHNTTSQTRKRAHRIAEQLFQDFVKLNPEFSCHYLDSRTDNEIILVTPDDEEILFQIRATSKDTGEVLTTKQDSNYSKYYSVFLLGVVLANKRPEVYLVPFNKVFDRKYFRLRENQMPGKYLIDSSSFNNQILSKVKAPI